VLRNQEDTNSNFDPGTGYCEGYLAHIHYPLHLYLFIQNNYIIRRYINYVDETALLSKQYYIILYNTQKALIINQHYHYIILL